MGRRVRCGRGGVVCWEKRGGVIVVVIRNRGSYGIEYE